ncbi:hypothetical protein D3C84_893240 [compost metagenome]
MLVLLLDLEATVAEQALQGFCRGETTSQGRRLLAGRNVTGEKDLGVRLGGQGTQRLFKGRSRQVEVDFIGGLHHRRQAEQQAAGQQGKAPGWGTH